MTKARLRVLLLEDDIDVAAGLGAYLQRHEVSVDFAYSAAQARQRIEHGAFDLFVFDVNLPGEDGISLCRELKRDWRCPQPVIFLTARGALQDKLLGFEAGALDWMVKPFAPAELLARIRALSTHHATRSTMRPLCAGAWELDAVSGLLRRGAQHLQLHASGRGILRRLLEAAPAAVPREALNQALWGDAAPESDPLRAHVYQLRQALQSAFAAHPIVTERGLGYRFDPDA
jgi:DNA-binding response OmpR family regulator